MKIQKNQKNLNDLFGYGEIRNIADTILDRAEENIEDYSDPYDAIVDALNDELIYEDNQWTIMKQYQRPSEANFTEAVEEFINDLNECVLKLEEF